VSRLAEIIRNSTDLHKDLYEIPEWEVTIEVRSMSARQRASYASLITDAGETTPDAVAETALSRVESLWGHMIVACCFDPETQERVFSTDDLDWLMEEKDGDVVGNLANKCLEVSGMGADSEGDAGKDSSASQIAEADALPNADGTSG
jgi:hypothetical protein